MQIVCATVSAAAQVLRILMAAHLRPARDFELRPHLSPTPPITFTMLVILTTAQVTKIGAVSDTTIVVTARRQSRAERCCFGRSGGTGYALRAAKRRGEAKPVAP